MSASGNSDCGVGRIPGEPKLHDRATILRVDPLKLLFWHCIVIGLLTIAHVIAGSMHGPTSGRTLNRLFRLDFEANVPTFFSALMLAITAAAASLIYINERDANPGRARTWLTIAALLIFMSFDEAAKFHEVFNRMSMARSQYGVLYVLWVVPYAILTVGVLLLLTKFWWGLPASLKKGLTLAAVVYITSAIGVELIENQTLAHGGAAVRHGAKMLFFIAVEESGEMVGVAIALNAMLRHLLVRPRSFRLETARVTAAGPVAAAWNSLSKPGRGAGAGEG